MNSYFWLLYTYSIQISVMLQFQSPLCVKLHVWIAILWVQLFYHLGSISTWYYILCILIYLLPYFYCRFDILTGSYSADLRDNFWAMDQSQKIILTPFNLFEWKVEMEILLRLKGLYRVTMEIEADPNATVEKIKWNNRRDEAYGLLCLSISRDLLFYILMDWHHLMTCGRSL